MATAIRHIPALLGKEAALFIEQADRALLTKGSVDFTEQRRAKDVILRKAKLR